MSRIAPVVLAAALAFGAVGCGAQAASGNVRRPAPIDERALRAPRHPDEPPPLIAPPPAYGNKIVMARAARSALVN